MDPEIAGAAIAAFAHDTCASRFPGTRQASSALRRFEENAISWIAALC
jgi:hypothetical protein